ncbi:carboxymuconolactone decarboxylase family protein [Halomarina ordinaria]|uniref:Carboxymuconolactone decarboxylase family protein n=1 Tax=Halomarina ordinaria TaxID=3033939 RepID=A0ABD5UIC1_9EURY|nr:carboxymuconolactone decarboxylase family protein [Halomarina sp. PSRA2]
MARITLPTREDLPEEYRYLLGEDALGDLDLLRAMGTNPRILQTYMRHGTALWREAGLSVRQVELAILTIARTLESTYEWFQHVDIARDVDLTDEEIRAVGGRDDGPFDDNERTLLRYARVAANDDVSTDVHGSLVAAFNEVTVAGTAALVAHYVATGRFVSVLAV